MYDFGHHKIYLLFFVSLAAFMTTNPTVRWCFTINNPTVDDNTFQAVLNMHCKFWIYQYEQAPTSTTKHIQGY